MGTVDIFQPISNDNDIPIPSVEAFAQAIAAFEESCVGPPICRRVLHGGLSPSRMVGEQHAAGWPFLALLIACGLLVFL
jgi:hypothetical protein